MITEHKQWLVNAKMGNWSSSGVMSNWSTGAYDEEQLIQYLRKSAKSFGYEGEFDVLKIEEI